MRLLLDEHFSPRLAGLLRDHYHRDVVAIQERPDLESLPDAEVLAAAIDEGRIVVTENVQDFVPLASRAAADLVAVPPDRRATRLSMVGAVATALDAFLEQHEAVPLGELGVQWLSFTAE